MASLLTASKRLLILGLLWAIPLVAWTQTFSPQGGEYALGALAGDQLFPSLNVTTNGGYVVWEDSAIDGNGSGIGAIRLDNNLSPLYGAFRVNQRTAGNQKKPQVAMLNQGGAAIVWQGGGQRFVNIYARFLNSAGTFTGTNDIRVNASTNADQVSPALAVMTNGNVFVVWSSWDYSSNSFMQDIRAQILATNGTAVGTNFYVNGTSASAPSELYNQRDPVVATLANGNILVAWVSENQGVPTVQYLQGTNWIHIYARLYSPTGVPLGSEFLVNSALHSLCANPAVSSTGSGGFTIAWSQRPVLRSPDGWDVYARTFGADGTPVGDASRMNSFTYGDQFGPKISHVGDTALLVWTSLGQDGSWEGVYGQLLWQGGLYGTEFQVNTTTNSRQMHPIVASDGRGRFLAAWTSFGRVTGFDLYAQRYAVGQPLPQPAPPFVSPLSQSELSVTWPVLSGFALSWYEVYQDGSPSPVATTTNAGWVASGFGPGSTHWFQLAFVLAGGQRSPLSAPTTNTTWGQDLKGKNGFPDGLPDNWQQLYFGMKTSDWDGPDVDSDGDGATNWEEFLAGTNPRDPNSVLKSWITATQQGRRLNWNTVAGYVYQVQVTADFQNWSTLGSPRFAPGTTDSILIPSGQGGGYYRITRVQ